MTWKVVIAPAAVKVLRNLPTTHARRVLAAIDGLRDDPNAGKALQGQLAGLRSLRVWPYRIIYQLHKRVVTITVVAVGHRRDVYR